MQEGALLLSHISPFLYTKPGFGFVSCELPHAHTPLHNLDTGNFLARGISDEGVVALATAFRKLKNLTTLGIVGKILKTPSALQKGGYTLLLPHI